MIEEFLRNIQTPVPEVKSVCDILLETCQKPDEWDGLIRGVVATLGEHDERIASRDDSLILQGVALMPGLVLKDYWTALSEKTKDAVWKYVNLIMLAGAKYINHSKKSKQASSGAGAGAGTIAGDDDDSLISQLNLGSGGDDNSDTRKKFEEEIAERLKDPALREKMIETIRKTIESSASGKGGTGEGGVATDDETAENIKRFMEGVKDTQIGKMVQEISQDLSGEFTPETLHLPDGKTMESMTLEDVLGLMGNSEVSSKIFGMVGKISDKIIARIQSGEISKEVLAKESHDFLGKSKDLIGLLNPQAAAMMNSLGLGGITGKQMKKAMKKASKMLESGTLPDASQLAAASTPGGARVATTRDRLRKKLEERKAASSSGVGPTGPTTPVVTEASETNKKPASGGKNATKRNK
jgi:hypothetical protein